jgi:TIGR03009 family protein
MRIKLLALPALLLVGEILFSQQPLAAPDAKLREVLGNWEKAMDSVESMLVFCKQTTFEKRFQAKEDYEGIAKYVKPEKRGQGCRASLKLAMKNRPEKYLQYIYTGTYFYQFDPAAKKIHVHRLQPVDNCFDLIFGFAAGGITKRYKVTYVPPNDKFYYYLRIEPLEAADRAEFSEARLVLTAKTYLPRQFWYRRPNGDEVTWDFPRVITDARIPLTEFATPQPPPGWKLELPQDSQRPRVIRQNPR